MLKGNLLGVTMVNSPLYHYTFIRFDTRLILFCTLVHYGRNVVIISVRRMGKNKRRPESLQESL